METQSNHVLKLKFSGGVYDAHVLDEAALVEITKLMRAITETGRTLWRHDHPERERLPRRFDESLKVALERIDESSAVPVLVRVNQPSEPQMFADDLTASVNFVATSFRASRNGMSFPEGLTTDLCDRYSQLGTALPSDSSLTLEPPGTDSIPIDDASRLAFRNRIPDTTMDLIDVTGRILAVDVHLRVFQIWLDSTTKAQAAFNDAQERQVINALKDHDSVRVRLCGTGRLLRTGEIYRIDQVDRVDTLGDETRSFDPDAPTIAEMVKVAFADVSDDVWSTFPSNLSERHDEYLATGEMGSS